MKYTCAMLVAFAAMIFAVPALAAGACAPPLYECWNGTAPDAGDGTSLFLQEPAPVPIVEPEPGDGEPGDGEPGDGEPGDGEPGDGEPGDGEPGDAPASEE